MIIDDKHRPNQIIIQIAIFMPFFYFISKNIIFKTVLFNPKIFLVKKKWNK